MKTEMVRLPEQADIAYTKAAEVINHGGLVAFPTETVYGLGGNALDPTASEKIYAAKGRPSDNPLIVHVADREQIDPLVTAVSEKAEKLMEAFWPGPLTIILPKSDRVPKETTGGLDTVALRMPDHPVALAMIRACGCPIAAPSANTSGRPSPTKAAHVAEDLDGRIEIILDGGDVGIGVESTIVDVTGELPYLLRPGYITKDMLEAVVGPVRIDPALEKIQQGQAMSADVAPRAPGMKYRHYAPQAPLTLVQGEPADVLALMKQQVAEAKAAGRRCAVICERASDFEGMADVIYALGDRKDTLAISRQLYDVLRDCDHQNIDVIVADDFGLEKDEAFGYAVQNRFMKAAGGHVIKGGSV